ncbi:hypothetical protein [Desulfoferrobacter suflitae]|uniref:hypothetical protein n=1 Tax=Desulfoferrobacter suflitae TaxID=2865782 RepID=UPI002164831B|nr:hypothetical protein [Desulfoferrobacter suflitae]MCK8600424.1 hypothetical protein [Desulfoferrobacter suflitae]
MLISHDLLEKTCKEMIETILLSLSHATKGTIYRIGPIPDVTAVRITSGIRLEDTDQIQWGLPEASDYNFPGKTWQQYQDNPGHVLEAMGWCVEKQKSWTADNPYEDIRSVRKQLEGEIEDFHHMEPVLVKKPYLYGDCAQPDYPLDWEGKPIWQDTEYLVVAVIKIHFLPYTIRRGDRSTKIIKKLSRILGTELLSLHIRETLSDAQKELARQRLQSCNVLAHELRNTLIKLGFIFSAINAEISFLREQWEKQLEKAFPELDNKNAILARLNDLLSLHLGDLNGKGNLGKIGEVLLSEQTEMANLALMPSLGEKWLNNKILPKWQRLLLESHSWKQETEEIQRLLARLGKAIWVGMDQNLALQMDHLPLDLRLKWSQLAYTDFSVDKLVKLEEIIKLLDHPALDIPHKQQTKKVLSSLKALVEMIPEVEERANRIIHSLKNGCSMEAS